MMLKKQPYPGNSMPNVNRDAKYSVRYGAGGVGQIEIIYYIGPKEYVRPATREHPKLVKLVNEAKGYFGGGFYINEFSHVLTRSGDGEMYCIGRYEELLQFDVDGIIVSAESPPGLAVGEVWTGPHVGRPYVLSVDCKDIYFKRIDGKHIRKDCLSEQVGSAAARALAKRLSEIKGTHGGRIYINERRHFYAPVQGDDEFLYLGSLGTDAWFHEPPMW
jgi:hypothetical protein